jgi:Domain of unknown function (DUF1905)/Bacteriocin-protection, YdeI or OmpD-Associated
MVTFTTRLLKFEKQGDKTGWTYLVVSKQHAAQLKPGTKTSFRVKGKLNDYPIEMIALLPMGDGDFILPFNNTMRKGTGKKEGDSLKVQLVVDERTIKPSADFIQCLKDEPRAYAFFKTLAPSHQAYFSKWIDSAKTESTKTKRITMALIALGSGQGYGEMIRANKGR